MSRLKYREKLKQKEKAEKLNNTKEHFFKITLKANPDNVTIQEGKKIILAERKVKITSTHQNKELSEIFLAKKLIEVKKEFIDNHIEVLIEEL